MSDNDNDIKLTLSDGDWGFDEFFQQEMNKISL